MVTNKIKRSSGEKIFNAINIIVLSSLTLCMIYPLWYVLVASFSDARLLGGFSGFLWKPLGFSVDAYRLMSKNPLILRGYCNTIFIVCMSLVFNIILTSFGAYGLSRKNLMFGKPIMLMIIFTMYFSGGIIPFYFTVKDLGLEDSIWSLIIPGAINTMNLIIMRTSFEAIPTSLEESARLDGAGHLTILFRIVIPLAKATIAVIVLYYAVANWNSWFNAMLFLNNRNLYPLQLILQEILIQGDTSSMTQMVAVDESAYVGETIKYAVIVVTILPILCIYPFVQKYFVKGVMIGAVKG